MIRQKNHLGNISLVCAALVMIATEALIYLGGYQHWSLLLLAASAEAATVGGVADWFAVTALFRPVPIPLLRRHTNILVANRDKFTAGAVDMVQNKWLSPPVIARELENFSASEWVLDYLETPQHREQLVEALRFLLARMADDLDRPELAEFVSHILKDQVRQADLAGTLGQWLEDAFRRGDHEHLWELLLESLEALVQDGTVRRQVKHLIEEAASSYKERGWMEKVGTFVAEKLGALDYDEVADDLTAQIDQFLKDAKHHPQHPLRKVLNDRVLEFAQRLTHGDEEACGIVRSIQANLAESHGVNEFIRQMLQRFKGTLQQELADAQGSLMQVVRNLVLRSLEEFRRNAAMRGSVDLWVRQTVTQMVERHHQVIGDMVGRSLSSLKDEDLVDQVQGKVWDDLQYIRLNGAVVGGMVGLVIATIKLLAQ